MVNGDNGEAAKIHLQVTYILWTPDVTIGTETANL